MGRRGYVAALASGISWALIGVGIVFATSPYRATPAQAIRTVAGGIVCAPLIALLVARLARGFLGYPGLTRAVVALVDLYLAAFLFNVASGIGMLLLAPRGATAPAAFRALVQDPILGTLLGLTYTGFVVLLWPLSYANHMIVARADRGAP